MKYNKIFELLEVRGMKLKNRVVMAPMGTNFANLDGSITEDHIKYYNLRAKGETGLITVENVCLDFPMGTNGTTQLRFDNDQYMPGMFKLVETLHSSGAKVSIQVNHAGASAYPGRLDGKQPVSSSNVPTKPGMLNPRALTKHEIFEIVRKYGEVADRVKRTGFDCIEIHAGHSYLLCQFLSPYYNKRTDEFGGSAENRARFTKLVLDEVRSKVGPMFPIVLRISADDFVEGGNTLEDTLEILKYLDAEVDIYNVSAGLSPTNHLQIDEMKLEDGWRSYLSKAVKDRFNKITMTSGNIRDPKVAEDIIIRGDSDLLVLGRGLIADPNWVKKVKYEMEDDIRKCISCNIGCADHRMSKSKPMRCTINPDLFEEDEYKKKKVKNDINVVVIGAGSAGIEAACTAAEVGCNVTLYEEKGYVGGLTNQISKLPDKKRVHDFIDYLNNRINNLENINLKLNTRANIDKLKSENVDLLISSTGSKPLLPRIPGLHEELERDERKVFTAVDLMNNLDRFADFKGKKIAVVGGGAVGLDVVEYFAERGAGEVSIIEMAPEVGRDLDILTKISMMTMLDKEKVNIHANTALTKVNKDSFSVKRDDNEFDIEFDYGFICLGMRSNNGLSSKLEDYAFENDIAYLNIGDSIRVRRIIDGVKEGRFNVLSEIEKIEEKIEFLGGKKSSDNIRSLNA